MASQREGDEREEGTRRGPLPAVRLSCRTRRMLAMIAARELAACAASPPNGTRPDGMRMRHTAVMAPRQSLAGTSTRRGQIDSLTQERTWLQGHAKGEVKGEQGRERSAAAAWDERVEKQTDRQTADKGQSARQYHRVLRDSGIDSSMEDSTRLMMFLFIVLISNSTTERYPFLVHYLSA